MSITNYDLWDHYRGMHATKDMPTAVHDMILYFINARAIRHNLKEAII